MLFSLAFIFNHAPDENSACIGQFLRNAMTVYTQIERIKRQGCPKYFFLINQSAFSIAAIITNLLLGCILYIYKKAIANYIVL